MTGTGIGELSPGQLARLEKRLGGRTATASRPTAQPVTRRRGVGPIPLSACQEQLWYFSRLAPDVPVYNEVVTIRKDGPLDVPAFRRAFNELVRRHEAWRTTFSVVDDEVVQTVHPARPYPLRVHDLGHLPVHEAERQAARLVARECATPYDLEKGPLLRPRLVRLAGYHHRLYLGLHHLIFDGVTLYRVVLPELVALYKAFSAGLPSPLPEPPVQYGDYALWEREWVASSAFAERLGRWHRRLGGLAPLELPLDRPRPVHRRFRGQMVQFSLEKGVAEGLRALAREHGATLFQVVATAFAAFLGRYCGQDDVTFATACDLRRRPELQSLVGYCLTPAVLRVDLEGDPTFVSLLKRVRGVLGDALGDVVPFERLVRELPAERGRGTNPVFQAMLVLEPPAISPDPFWSIHQQESEIGNAIGCAKFDLNLELDERPEGHIAGRLIYDTDLFEDATAKRMASHWIRLLRGVVEDPWRPIGDTPLLSPEEWHRQVVEWNATSTEHPRDRCVHELVQRQTERDPDAVAVEHDGHRLTYVALDRWAASVARRLRAAGVGRGQVVAICVEPSLDIVAAMLGVLRAGAAYVPMDPEHPRGRMATILAASRPAAVVTQPHLVADLPVPPGLPVLVTDGPTDQGCQSASHTPAPDATARPSDPAYVLYTSGSTGVPKGVRVTHANVANLMAALGPHGGGGPRVGPGDVVLAVASCCFDMSVADVFPTLGAGARVVLASREQARDPRRLADLIASSGATLMHATPATWQMLVGSGWAGRDTLVAVSGGEALSISLATELLSRCAAVWNGYGPTEATVYTTFARVTQGEAITIGRPIDNAKVYVVDRGGRPVPVGVAGEIVISGEGVADGYLDRPEETAERFRPDPFAPGQRTYRTGDLGRLQPDGRLEHLGRIDHQVKLRGFRIEPGEIEAVLTSHPDVTAAVVTVNGDDTSERRLVGYVVTAGPSPVADLMQLARSRLPGYMVPSAIVSLPALPTTPNGKVDRAALPAPHWGSAGTGTRCGDPRTPTEEALARIWGEALGVEKVGIHDNFFDLGGHSLLAVRTLIEVERRLGRTVPVAAMVGGGATIAGLASAIDPGGDPGRSSPNSPGDRPPLFFVHPDERAAMTMRHFRGPLGSDREMVALLPERVGGHFVRRGGIEALAAPMLASIRKAQAHGPYHLVGYSLGGLLAYEIAGRLRDQGEPIGWLGILDVIMPVSLRQSLRALRGRGNREVLVGSGRMVERQVKRALVRAGVSPRQGPDDFDWRGATLLAGSYSCRGHDAPMDLFVTEESVGQSYSPDLGWARVHRGSLRVQPVPGDHMSMVEQPHVAVLADLVVHSLRGADLAGAAAT